jgi:hypothetical protein
VTRGKLGLQPAFAAKARREVNDRESAVQCAAVIIGHRHAIVHRDFIPDLDGGARRGRPELLATGLHQHVGVARGVHGLDHAALEAAEAIFGGRGFRGGVGGGGLPGAGAGAFLGESGQSGQQEGAGKGQGMSNVHNKDSG